MPLSAIESSTYLPSGSSRSPAIWRSLVAIVRRAPITYQSVTVDRYGRIVAVVWAGTTNLSCWQLQHGQAIYKPKWDNRRLTARACPKAAMTSQ